MSMRILVAHRGATFTVPKSINIIARTNGVGLDRDVDLIHHALSTAGFRVTVSHCRGISPLRRIWAGKQHFAANIFLERVFPRWFGSAAKNFLIPNQERFPERQLKHLENIDHVLCKSRHAEQIFADRGSQCRFIGFTSTDMLDPAVEPDYQSFLHLAGRSTLKGTETILKLWKKHPEWPRLTLIQCKENAPAEVPPNVRLISDYIPHEEIKNHLNRHGVHLCTSLSEGWGHYIVEAMSCRAVVVTTDGPPMNELITPERGVLVPAFRKEPRHLGINYHADPSKLETMISELLLKTSGQKQDFGEKARTWFEKNDARLQKDLPQVITSLLNA